jgi:hypothetical protein
MRWVIRKHLLHQNHFMPDGWLVWQVLVGFV